MRSPLLRTENLLFIAPLYYCFRVTWFQSHSIPDLDWWIPITLSILVETLLFFGPPYLLHYFMRIIRRRNRIIAYIHIGLSLAAVFNTYIFETFWAPSPDYPLKVWYHFLQWGFTIYGCIVAARWKSEVHNKSIIARLLLPENLLLVPVIYYFVFMSFYDIGTYPGGRSFLIMIGVADLSIDLWPLYVLHFLLRITGFRKPAVLLPHIFLTFIGAIVLTSTYEPNWMDINLYFFLPGLSAKPSVPNWAGWTFMTIQAAFIIYACYMLRRWAKLQRLTTFALHLRS